MFHKPAQPTTPDAARGDLGAWRAAVEHCVESRVAEMRWHTRQSIELGTFGGHMDVLGPAAGEHRGNLLK